MLLSGLSQISNSNAMSLWAKVTPPYLPALDSIPIASVASTHFLGVRLKLLNPNMFANIKYE
jgi:hypothetical protein